MTQKPRRRRPTAHRACGPDHQALYAAECAAFDGTDLESQISLAEARRRVAAVTSSEWWTGPEVTVLMARADARSSSARTGAAAGRVDIRLAASQLTLATVAHELAHALAGVTHQHDATYRRAYLDVIAVLTNLDSTDRRGRLHVDALDAAFAASQLAVGERKWPAPGAETSGGAIAL